MTGSAECSAAVTGSGTTRGLSDGSVVGSGGCQFSDVGGRVVRRHELTDQAWAEIAPLLPAIGRPGGQWAEHRALAVHSGARWPPGGRRRPGAGAVIPAQPGGGGGGRGVAGASKGMRTGSARGKVQSRIGGSSTIGSPVDADLHRLARLQFGSWHRPTLPSPADAGSGRRPPPGGRGRSPGTAAVLPDLPPRRQPPRADPPLRRCPRSAPAWPGAICAGRRARRRVEHRQPAQRAPSPGRAYPGVVADPGSSTIRAGTRPARTSAKDWLTDSSGRRW